MASPAEVARIELDELIERYHRQGVQILAVLVADNGPGRVTAWGNAAADSAANGHRLTHMAMLTGSMLLEKHDPPASQLIGEGAASLADLLGLKGE